MKQLKQFIIEKLKLGRNKVQKYNYFPETREELKKLIIQLLKERGPNANLNDIDVSEITDMTLLFKNTEFDGDISNWDVRKVEDTSWMFHVSSFTGKNGDISRWEFDSIEFMDSMFQYSDININLDDWNISKETSTREMFNDCPLEKNPPVWYKK